MPEQPELSPAAAARARLVLYALALSGILGLVAVVLLVLFGR
jgi:hypothetical protein